MAKMDASQISAATFSIDTPLLLQAGAGSGKTQTMATRIAFLLESGVPSRSILGICFTRQAAETLRERVARSLPPTLAGQAHVLKLKTFHAFGLECLRRFGSLAPGTQVLDARQQRQLAKVVVMTYAIREKSAEAVTDLVDYVNHAKTMKVLPIAQSDPCVQNAYLFPFYQRMLHEEYDAVDFGDLQQMFYYLIRPVPAEVTTTGGEDEEDDASASVPQPERRLVPSPVCLALRAQYTHFVVDEFQDFNELQVELLALLADDACRVTCVGDPNQCIYTWRGAMPNVFDVWKKRFPQTAMLHLALNYRSDGPIVDAANIVVHATQLAYYHREDRPVTLVQCATEDDELQAVLHVLEHVLRGRDANLHYDDIAILCRTRRRVQLFCDVLSAQRIPFKQLKAMAVDRLSTMRSLLAFLRLCLSPHSREGNADVRTVLYTAPAHHLAAGAAKKFLFSLEAVCQGRRDVEATRIRAWRHTVNNAAEDSDAEVPYINNGTANVHTAGQLAHNSVAPALGIHPETYSFFAVLQDLVYHNFSGEVYPKLEVPKKSQKTIRHMVQIVVHAREMLAQPSCDVELVLRYMLREGGYESESTSAVVTRTVAKAGGGVKRQRGNEKDDGQVAKSDAVNPSRNRRVGALLMDQCAAQHNAQQRQPLYAKSPSDARRRPMASQVGGDGGFEDDVLPPEEEAAVWEEQRMNLPELVLHTYRGVHETLQREVAQQVQTQATTDEAVDVIDTSSASQSRTSAPAISIDRSSHPMQRAPAMSSHQRRPSTGADNSTSVFSTGSCAGTPTLMQSLCPPAVVLRRVLDEFVSLVASDDYGPMREAGEAPTDVAATHWVGQVTVGTVHRAKGMEWPAVLLPGCWVGEYPVKRSNEERRVFYVAMSRAMKHLVCFTAREKSRQDDDSSVSSVFDLNYVSDTLEETPFLAALAPNLERVAFLTLKTAYLQEHGYI